MAQQQQFSTCNFIRTEVNHDLGTAKGGPINVRMNNSLDFKTIAASYLDANADGVGCNGYDVGPQRAGEQHELYNDDQIVQEIFGISKNDFKHSLPYVGSPQFPRLPAVIGPRIPVKVKHQDGNHTTSETRNVEVRKVHKPYNNELMELFPHPDHMFFIIDTGGELVHNILKSLTLPINVGQQPRWPVPPKLHVIHSVMTLGDSARKTVPDAGKYKSNNQTVELFSWYYTRPITVPRDDRFFMSSFRIDCREASAGWMVRQDWHDPNDAAARASGMPLYQTLDAKRDNNITMVNKHMKQDMVVLSANARETSLNIQKKRSGDHLQIREAKNFPATAADDALVNNFLYVRGPGDQGSFPKFVDPAAAVRLNEEWYRRRTFFITGDWPAFAYAAYNQVNAILVYKDPNPLHREKSCAIRIYFP